MWSLLNCQRAQMMAIPIATYIGWYLGNRSKTISVPEPSIPGAHADTGEHPKQSVPKPFEKMCCTKCGIYQKSIFGKDTDETMKLLIDYVLYNADYCLGMQKDDGLRSVLTEGGRFEKLMKAIMQPLYHALESGLQKEIESVASNATDKLIENLHPSELKALIKDMRTADALKDKKVLGMKVTGKLGMLGCSMLKWGLLRKKVLDKAGDHVGELVKGSITWYLESFKMGYDDLCNKFPTSSDTEKKPVPSLAAMSGRWVNEQNLAKPGNGISDLSKQILEARRKRLKLRLQEQP